MLLLWLTPSLLARASVAHYVLRCCCSSLTLQLLHSCCRWVRL